MPPKHLILTNCTARKRGGAEPLTLARCMAGETLQDTAAHWKTAFSSHGPRMAAHWMYVGRSISDAKRIASLLQAPLWIASAGLGLVHADDQVAPYDLTPSSSGGLREVLAHHAATPAQWWEAVCGRRGLAALLKSNASATLLAALPSNYVEMIATELARCSESQLHRIRLFTSRAGAMALPQSLAALAMPYDERLESLQGYAGTRADFPQRAMRHFVECLGAEDLDISNARTRVALALAKQRAPKTVPRKRLEDEDIKALIREHWAATGGRSSVMLRRLRDEAMVACEQGRFAQLWRSVREESFTN